MTGGSVCVVGSFMMDFAVRAPRRPAPGETIVGTSFEMFLGGKGFNQAIAAARAGARTAMVGRLGDDEFGRQFLDRLATEGIDGTHVAVDDSVGTGIGAPLIEDSGENSIVIVPRANDFVSPADIERATPVIASASVVLLQLELPLVTAVAAAKVAKRGGACVVLNPAPAPSAASMEAFQGLIDVLVPNEIEASALGAAADGAGHAEAAAALAKRTGAAIVMTAGARGCLVVADEGSLEIPAHVLPVVDTVGAGDAFCGALASWLSAGASLHDAVVFANAAGALAVTRAGAEPAMPTLQAIVDLLNATKTVASG